MKVLVIGSGGREAALCWKISKSQRVRTIYCAPGNGGTSEFAENIDINPDEIDKLIEFVKENQIDLTIVGPELPLVMGIVDKFHENNLRIFGVNKDCARLEGSKDYSKAFMEKYNIPTAKYRTFTRLEDAIEGLKEFSYPLVIKADGLCAGKGVVIIETEKEAKEILKEILEDGIFGDGGSKIIIEEYLDGVETSLICFVTEGKIIPMESAKDYKNIYDGDKGPNTGGVGAYSPSTILDKNLYRKIEKDILNNIKYGLENEEMNYRGILYIGLMIVDGEPNVLEFNVRLGDPETQVLMPRLDAEIVDLFQKTIDGTLNKVDLIWSEEHCMTVILASEGYPGEYETGFEISGLDKLDEDIILFHNGTIMKSNKLVTNGGRVLSMTTLGDSIEDARQKIYSNINKIEFKGKVYRKDIGEI